MNETSKQDIINQCLEFLMESGFFVNVIQTTKNTKTLQVISKRAKALDFYEDSIGWDTPYSVGALDYSDLNSVGKHAYENAQGEVVCNIVFNCTGMSCFTVTFVRDKNTLE